MFIVNQIGFQKRNTPTCIIKIISKKIKKITGYGLAVQSLVIVFILHGTQMCMYFNYYIVY